MLISADPNYDEMDKPMPEGWHTVKAGPEAPRGFNEWRDSDHAVGEFRLVRHRGGFLLGFSNPDTAFDFRMRFT